jgi:hypothetical protein
MEFLVEFEVDTSVTDGTPESELLDREHAEAPAAADIVEQGRRVDSTWANRRGSAADRAPGRGDVHGAAAARRAGAGVSADRQTVLRDGTALGDVRYTLRTTVTCAPLARAARGMGPLRPSPAWTGATP